MTAVVALERAMHVTGAAQTTRASEGWRGTCYECTPIWRSEFYPQGHPGGAYVSALIDAAEHDKTKHGIREHAPSAKALFGS